MSGISRDDWLAALAALEPVYELDPTAITMAEFAALLQVSKDGANTKMQVLVKAGKAVPVWTQRLDARGRLQRAPGYRLVAADGENGHS